MADSGGRDAALLLDMLLAAQDARAEGLDEVWRAARERVLTTAQLNSPLANRPYALRHAAVSTWLNAGDCKKNGVTP